jgi:serine protease DegQ
MRKIWLLFAQTVTISLAVLFVLNLFKPNILGSRDAVVAVQELVASPSTSVAKNASTYSLAVKKAMPAVVNVYTSKETRVPAHPLANDPLFRRFFGDQFDVPQRTSSLGSGVVVSPQGYILTNHHVVESADAIEVALADGRTASAQVVGSDPDTDLAVLKIGLQDLPAVTFGHSEQLQVGDVVLAIGNPFGVGQTVTMGIVSALGRSHLGINTFENFIQTDAAINPGNSGGALVDAEGNLVGINSAIYSRSGGSLGIGFAIPASIVKQVMEQIVRSGSVTRGWIGVEGQDITPDLAASFGLKEPGGVLIAGVLRGGPADRGGIQPGDVLVEIDGQRIQDSAAMLNRIAALPPGKASRLKILRKQREWMAKVEIGRRPKMQQAN